MSIATDRPTGRRFMGSRTAGSPAQFIPVIALGMGLSVFLALSFILCVSAFLILPGFPGEHPALTTLLPDVTLLNWTSFCLGLIESLAWGWYIALVFGPIYNFFAAR